MVRDGPLFFGGGGGGLENSGKNCLQGLERQNKLFAKTICIIAVKMNQILRSDGSGRGRNFPILTAVNRTGGMQFCVTSLPLEIILYRWKFCSLKSKELLTNRC